MLELLHWSNQKPPPSIFKRLADSAVAVDYRYGMTKTPIGRKAYFECGNKNYSYNLDTFELVSLTGLRNPNLQQPYGCAVVVGSIVYIVGTSRQATWAPATYSTSANTWSTLRTNVSGTNNSFYVTGAIGAYMGGNLIQLGGTDLDNYLHDDIILINPVTKAWNRVSLSNVVRYIEIIAGEPIGSYLYVLGATGALYRASISIYSASWTAMKAAPVAPGKTGARCVTYANKLYFYGGGFGKTLYCYDPASNNWSVVGVGGPGGNYPGICLDGSLLYIFSGVQVWTAQLDPTKWE